LSRVTTFFRHCPGCGRRFEIRLVSKTKVSESAVLEKMPETAVDEESAMPGVTGVMATTILSQEGPVLVDEKEFCYKYRCKHCGHEWTEIREEETGARAPEGYEGD